MTHAERAKRRSEIVRRYSIGWTVKRLADEYKLSSEYIMELLWRAQVYVKPVAGLSAKERSQLLAAYRRHDTLRAIGKRFGISLQRVHQIAVEAGMPMRRKADAE